MQFQTGKVCVGYIRIVNCSAIFIAYDNQYFQSEGIDVELIPLIGGEKIMTALRQGEVDIGFSNVASTIFGFDDGAKFVSIVGGAAQDATCPVHAIFVRADSTIQTVADLVNTKVAVNTNRAIDEGMVPPLVVKYGADPSGIQFVPIPFPEMFIALKQGDVDAVVQIKPFVTIGNADSALRRISYNYVELQPVTEISSMVAMRPWAEEHLEIVQAFRRAIIQAAEFANTHPQETRNILSRYVPLEQNILDTVVLPRFIEGSLNEDLLDEMIFRMRQAGWLKSNFSATIPSPKIVSKKRGLL
jgi:NitT/TauT family transport system substrate-binding protein